MALGTEVGGGPRHIVLDRDPAPLPKRGQRSPLPIFGPFLLWPNGCIYQDELGTEVGLSLGDIMLDGDPAVPPLKGHSSQFSANVRCGQTAGWTKMPLGMKVGLGPGDFVFDGDPAPQKKGTAPTQFLAHVYCGQTAGWINMPLGTEVNLGPGDAVLEGVAALPVPSKRGTAPRFRPCLLWPNGYLDEDANTAQLLLKLGDI